MATRLSPLGVVYIPHLSPVHKVLKTRKVVLLLVVKEPCLTPGGYSTKFLPGVWGPNLKTFTLFSPTKIWDFPHLMRWATKLPLSMQKNSSFQTKYPMLIHILFQTKSTQNHTLWGANAYVAHKREYHCFWTQPEKHFGFNLHVPALLKDEILTANDGHRKEYPTALIPGSLLTTTCKY